MLGLGSGISSMISTLVALVLYDMAGLVLTKRLTFTVVCFGATPQHVPLPEAQTSFALLPRAYRHGRLMLQFMHWKG
jgi:hypothetical protein